MEPTRSKAGRRYCILLLLFLGYMIVPGSAALAQELNGVKIQVNPDALTILKFDGDIRNFEFGKSDMFTAQVQDEVKLRIKTLSNNPTPTNLTVTEGTRTHVFILEVVKKIDINTFKGYYDYSDLKALKKMVASAKKVAVPSPTAAEAPGKNAVTQAISKDNQTTESAAHKPTKAELAKAKKEQKARELAEAAAAKKENEEAAKKQALADKELQEQKAQEQAILKQKQQAKEEAQQKVATAETEKKRLKEEKAAREKAEKEGKLRQQQLEKENKEALAAAQKREQEAEKKRKQEEQEQQALKAKCDQEIAAAKEKDRKELLAKAAAQQAVEEKRRKAAEAERVAQKQREEEAARKRLQQIEDEKKAEAAAEKQRIAAANAAVKKEAALEAERRRQEEIARKKQLELEKEQKRQADLEAKREEQRLRREKEEAERKRIRQEKAEQAKRDAEHAAIQAQERTDAAIKNPYWKTEWHQKYPAINFAEIPTGQTITGEYYLPKDTIANYAAALKCMELPARINKKSDAASGVHMILETMMLSGVNSFFRIRIINNSGKDFLVGRMMLTWWKKEGGSYYLIPVYVTEFPVIYPAKEATVVYGCRGVNAADDDDFQFSLKERTDGRELQIPFIGKLYNKELNR